MSQIRVSHLSFAHEGSYDNVFEDVSFELDTNWKLGFIGRNGRGKTTFLRLLMGQYEYRGKIDAEVSFTYFPYEVTAPSRPVLEILESIAPTAAAWELIRELSYLEVSEEVINRPYNTLSPGEQAKVLLASMFLNEDRFLLIDEPTNHLDAKGRQLVAAYLKRKRGFILVSHDRCFLDGCVDHILSLNRATIEVQSGNFSSWYQNQMRREAYEEGQNEALRRDIRRLQQASARTSHWSGEVEKTKKGQKVSGIKPDKGYIGHKAAKMMKSAKNIESRRGEAAREKSKLLKDKENAPKLKLVALDFFKERLLTLADVSIQYGEHKVCRGVSFGVERGERVALCGNNGSGKSSILKLIQGTEISHGGSVEIPPRLLISYVSQDTSALRGHLSGYAEECQIEESLFKAVLRQLDFERVQFEKDMADFSGGQKKKVLLAASLCRRAHLYLWDEPLNFIDVYSRLQLEELIASFQPTLLFVDHDAMFIANVATKVVKLTGGDGGKLS